MTLRDELETAMLEVYKRTGEEVGYWAGYFLREIRRNGALATAKHLLSPVAGDSGSKGFRALQSAGRLDLTVEAVALRSDLQALFTTQELEEATRRLQWAGPRKIADIAAEVNLRSQARPIGRLQEIRDQRSRASRRRTRKLFDGRSTFDAYAYHTGGRTELQFNIGFEMLGHREVFRDGVAFSLEPSRNLPSIAPLVPKIQRFNEYLRIHAEDFAGFRMWHFVEGKGGDSDYPSAPISSELVIPGSFIFLGRRQPAANVDVTLILDDFDALLPLYEFVEGTGPFPTSPKAKGDFDFVPGRTPTLSRTRATIYGQTIDVTLRHNDIQRALFDYISSLHRDEVCAEVRTGNGTLIDLGRRRGDHYWFYEIKTGISARTCIREALGQLLEYAFWPGGRQATALVVVGEAVLDRDAEFYLQGLRSRFGLPIFYQQFEMTKGTLVGNGPE
jgi:hypothetical protein